MTTPPPPTNEQKLMEDLAKSRGIDVTDADAMKKIEAEVSAYAAYVKAMTPIMPTLPRLGPALDIDAMKADITKEIRKGLPVAFLTDDAVQQIVKDALALQPKVPAPKRNPWPVAAAILLGMFATSLALWDHHYRHAVDLSGYATVTELKSAFEAVPKPGPAVDIAPLTKRVDALEQRSPAPAPAISTTTTTTVATAPSGQTESTTPAPGTSVDETLDGNADKLANDCQHWGWSDAAQKAIDTWDCAEGRKFHCTDGTKVPTGGVATDCHEESKNN